MLKKRVFQTNLRADFLERIFCAYLGVLPYNFLDKLYLIICNLVIQPVDQRSSSWLINKLRKHDAAMNVIKEWLLLKYICARFIEKLWIILYYWNI